MSIANLYPQIRPSLNLDFANSDRLDPRVTFTRASTATFFDSAGVLTSAAIAAPRLDYDPATLAARGLLIEEQRTNLCLQSEDWGSATWSKSGSTITANATTAPTGTTVADKLVEDTSTGTHITTQTISLGGSVDNSAYVISVFAKASERTRFQLFDNAQASSGITSFDLSNGTVVSGTGTITAVGNGWYRCSVFPLKSTSITSTLTIRLISTGTTTSYTGDGTSGIFVFGAQLEAGAFPTSYIPTTTTALTRSADVASVNTLSPWYNATEGTLYVQAQDMSDAAHATSELRAASINDGTANNTINIVRVPASAQARARVVTGGTPVFNTLTTAWPLATQAKIGLAYKANDFAACLGGGAVATSASGAIPTVSALTIGNITTGGSNGWVGWIQRLTYYPRKLSSAELQAITA